MEHLKRTFTAADLNFDPPKFPLRILKPFIQQEWGLSGTMMALDGERDQNVRMRCSDGNSYVVKVSHKDEKPGVVEFQTKALNHLAEMEPDLPLPRIVKTSRGRDQAILYSRHGLPYQIRVLTWLKGRPLAANAPVSKRLLANVGHFQARVAKAFRSFHHSHAGHFMAWDIKQGLVLNRSIRDRVDLDARALTSPFMGRLEEEVLPKLKTLRHQVIHGDAHNGNVLVLMPSSESVAGLIDFGDMVHAPLIQDIAVTAASFTRMGEGSLENAAIQVAAYNEVFPLESEEIDILYDLILLRLVTALFMYDFRRNSIADSPAWLETERPDIINAYGRWQELDRELVTDAFREACKGPGRDPVWPSSKQLADRRHEVLAPTYRLFYENPVQIVRGTGCWLWDSEGKTYLDCYNNVASVGHCHPRVVEALSDQASTLNTHTRYLHKNIVELGERITETMPRGLDTCFFVCSGTEANDLAIRIARSLTGKQGLLVSENAYHGNGTTVSQTSTCMYLPEMQPEWIRTFAPPDPEQGLDTAEQAEDAVNGIAELEVMGAGFAAAMIDPIFDAAGVFAAPDGYLERFARIVGEQGALLIADEVQSGFGRMGDRFWGFEGEGFVPDIVTLGKPMGAGHPVAAVVTRREIAEVFAEENGYFNTFGGNPVSAAAALAVLDVIQEEGLQQNVAETGAYLRERLEVLAAKVDCIHSVTGKGMFLGLVIQDYEGNSDGELAGAIVNMLRDEGVLVGRTGRHDHVVKIRPPLVFDRSHADILVDRLVTVFTGMGYAP